MSASEIAFDVFFSYQRRDQGPVEAVAHTLTHRGLRVFLDRWYLAPGQPWPQALERALASCEAVAIFLGADGLGPWQQRERDLALDRQGREPGFPVIPVLLTRADPALGFLKLTTWVDLSVNVADEAALEILCAAIRRRSPGPAVLQKISAVRSEICPYRGLYPFREEDAAFFCGREAFTDQLVEAVEHTSLVAVVGASGSGKSSVVRAGLIPRLRQTKAGGVWEIATLVPTDRPLHSLAAALVPILEPEMTRVDRLAEINKLAGHFADGTVALRDVVADALRAQPGTDRLLLFVDQWEELYTLATGDGARRRFLAEVLDASAKRAITIVLTLRGDFFGQALSDRSFADRLQDAQVNLGPMKSEELRRSITEPAEKAGLRFERGLIDRILEDVGQEPGNLPLLEFVLASLWEQRQGDTLLHDAYERMGGVQGAIAACGDAEFEKLNTAQKEAAKRYLVQMVRPGEATEDTRQRARLPIGNEVALTVLRRLADARLVVTTRNLATGEETVEVSHEALIRNWALLRGWVDQDREFLRNKARIEATAAIWEREKRDPSRLLPAGRPLAEGEEMLANRREDLPASVVAFIEASAAAAASRRRSTLLIRAAALAAVLLTLASGGLYWDLYVREQDEYYNSYAKRLGAFEGVGRVPADDAAHRSQTLRFVRKGRLGPVIRVDAIDGSGGYARAGLQDPTAGAQPVFGWDEPTRLCSFVWERDSRGRLSKQTMRDAMGRIIGSFVYTDEDGRTAEFRGKGGYVLPIGAATTITYERIEDGPNRGQDRQERYSDAFGKPRPFLTGSFATQAEYNPQGLLVHAMFLGPDGMPMRNNAGFAQVRVQYNEVGSPVKTSFFDESGNPVRSKAGMAGWTMTYDARGNQVEEAYFDEEGKPTRRKDDGYAKLTLAYDARGREIRRAYFDETGKPMRNKDGYAKVSRVFDLYSRLVEETYFDGTDKAALRKDCSAKVAKLYDGAGNLVEEAYFDRESKPTRNKDGYAKISWIFDNHGQPAKEAYFDRAGKLTRSKDGYAKRTWTYDERGNPPIEEAYFDEAEKPTISKGGYAKITKEYDGAGHLVEESYFDQTGKPTISKEGYAKITKEYDGDGHLVGEAYFDRVGKPTLSKEGYAKRSTNYDDHGNESKYAYFDERGKPTVTKSGLSSVVFAYDARGNMVRRTYYDEDGKPTRSKDNYAGLTKTYDASSNAVEDAYFDEAGQPTAFRGYTKITVVYDAGGNQIESRCFGEGSRPTRSEDGYARVTQVFDERGNLSEQSYFDEAGKPTRSKEGFVRLTQGFDERGNLTEQSYFDEAGKPMQSRNGYAKAIQAFDERSNVTEQAYFDEAGKPTRSRDGYASRTQVFDERSDVTEESYFDEAGKPTRSTKGFARLIQAFDERSNVTKETYFDETGKLTRAKDGYASLSRVFDERGNLIEEAYFDEAGKLTRSKDGISDWRAVYDARGNNLKTDLFDENGKHTPSEDGYATITKAFDARGNRIAEAYYDVEGKPIRSKQGYARVAKVYDARGHEIEATYLDEQGSPTISKDGYAKVRRVYDPRDEAMQETYFNEKGLEIRSPPNAPKP
jgi:TIR domain